MAVDQKIVDLLKLSELRSKLPENPKVVDIRVEDYVDTGGEDALRVWAILDEEVDVENFSGDDISDLKTAIHDRLLEQGIELWPYVRLAKQSELDEHDEEDEE